jgi:crotonobetaine/carnitine-CoA ligase
VERVDTVGNRSIGHLLREQSAVFGDKTAVVFEDEQGECAAISYRTLEAESTRAADAFRQAGIAAGDKVVVHLANCQEFVLAWFGLAKLGAVMVPTNTMISGQELDYQVRKGNAIAAVTSEGFDGLFDDFGFRLRILVGNPQKNWLSWDAFMARGTPDAHITPPDSEAPMQILFTSGSTGKPKGVLITHAEALWSGIRYSQVFAQRSDDCGFCVMPLFHVNTQTALMASLTVGGHVAIMPRFSASKWIQQVNDHGATISYVIGTLVRMLLEQPPSPLERAHKLRALANAINVSPETWNRFEQRYGVRLINGYGMTEAYADVLFAPMQGDRKVPSLGRAAVGREVKIVRPDGTDAGIGEVGEIIFRGVPGRTMLPAYYDDVEATNAVLRDGWFHTGDNGSMDEDGYFWWFDRKKDTIKRGGENVSSLEVEAILREHDAIAEAAVVAGPDSIWDEAVVGFVVAKPGMSATEGELIAYCRDRLAKFKVPSRIEFIEAMPLTAIGKIEKRTLYLRAKSEGKA